MSKKQFKTESKKLLDMMVNSIYTNKEIFLRELISNASDAIDKEYVRALTDEKVKAENRAWEIRLEVSKENRTLSISDNGCGMNREELENNLGTIAKSGTLDFKNDPGHSSENIDVIGQFGVGFYSAFMVADNIKVYSKTDDDQGYVWESSGADGYTVKECDKESTGSQVVLHLKEDTEDTKYSEYLNDWTLTNLVKKYSDYIHYPIKMMTSSEKLKEGSEDEYETIVEDKTLNSMTPIWKKPEKDVTEDEYFEFYKEKFYDYENPLKYVKQHTEGMVSYDALLYIPGRAPYDYYTREFEKGLQLYSSGVMIMEKCADLLPDYYSFVKGVVDSPDLSLNISREMLQQDKQLKLIAKNLETKINTKLLEMQEKDREAYEKFWQSFGTQIKYGIYSDYGMHKDALGKLLMFKSSLEEKFVTLKEYTERMADSQTKIYYAAGESIQQISLLPQVASAKAGGFEVLFLTENVDEFALKMMRDYDGKEFANVCSEAFDTANEEEKEKLKKLNEESKELLDALKTCLGGKVDDVRFTNKLNDYAACISNEGEISASMANALNKMPGQEEKIKASLILEINAGSPVAESLKEAFTADKDKFNDYAALLYENARLASGLTIEDPAQFSKLISKLMK